MSEHIHVKDEAGVRLITFNRPDKKNALTHAMYAAMADALLDADTNPAIRVSVFTGAGDAFTSGNDLLDFMQRPPQMGASEPPPVERFLHAIATAQKPVMAAVNGLAVGVGVTMLLHCDLVYAADTAKFRAPFVDLGLVPEAASSLVLPALVGRARAAELFLLGETWTAREAAETGIVVRTAPPNLVLAETLARAHKLAAKAPAAVRATKALMTADRASILARMKEEGAIFSARLSTEEFAEAAQAFMAKRTPDFSRFA